jgi:hypothetical protein
MSFIEKELDRLEKYAEALGIRVVYKSKQRGDNKAEWAVDGTEITIYLDKNESTTQIILDLLHELGHHMHWVYNNRSVPLKLDNALEKENPNKKDREAIYNDEVNGSVYHEVIYKELGLKIPFWKVQVERDQQLMIYEYFLNNNTWPTIKTKSEFRKKLIKKYKK